MSELVTKPITAAELVGFAKSSTHPTTSTYYDSHERNDRPVDEESMSSDAPSLPGSNVTPWAIGLAAAMASELLLLAAFGWFHGATTPDTLSYRAVLIWPDAFAGMRHPLYGLFLEAMSPIEAHLTAIAILQATFHVMACALLFREACRFGLGAQASFSLAASAFFSQAFLLYGRQVLPEAPAFSAMIIALAAMFRWTGCAQPAKGALLCIAICSGLSIFLRPIFLAALPVMPAMTLYLTQIAGSGRPWRRTLAVAVAVCLPLLAQSTVRAFSVGDFNVVSFGGFAMAGVAGLMMEPEDVPLYPSDMRNFAGALLSKRTAAEQAGTVYATPLNSSGQRSFISAALGYFDIYARTIDHLTWGVVLTFRADGESWVQFNKRMQHFALATLFLKPERWAAWIVGGGSRFVGRAIVTNGPFVIFAILLLLTAAARPSHLAYLGTRISPRDWGTVCLFAFGWAAIGISLGLLTSFPATRYIDTAGMFLPALPLLGLIAIWPTSLLARAGTK
jgi:hypothetical protein